MSTSFVTKLQVAFPFLKENRITTLLQFLRFCVVGCLNTTVDLIVFAILAWSFPTSDIWLLLLYNSLSCIIAALNSFYWNKYWTFQVSEKMTREELMRFSLVALGGTAIHDAIILGVAQIFPIFIYGGWLWTNGLKVCAIFGTMLLSFLVMRLWVFTRKTREGFQQTMSLDDHTAAVSDRFHRSLSVILPAYNEEAAIANTIQSVGNALSAWMSDFEVIVVNDGSKDRTQEIVEAVVAVEPRVRLINHQVNQGCGAALVSGFEKVSKDYAFYMDADGQFDINDLRKFFPLVEEYDGVFGYRIDRQDTWLRKLNAWGWNRIVRYTFGIDVHDIDCAFKLFNAHYFRTTKLEARGALLLTEIVYKFMRSGYTYTQIGVRHLPRHGGKGTGAKITVILRAFAELFFYAYKWYQEENGSGKKENDIEDEVTAKLPPITWDEDEVTAKLPPITWDEDEVTAKISSTPKWVHHSEMNHHSLTASTSFPSFHVVMPARENVSELRIDV